MIGNIPIYKPKIPVIEAKELAQHCAHWCNRGMAIMELTNCFLIEFEFCFIGVHTHMVKSQWLRMPQACGLCSPNRQAA